MKKPQAGTQSKSEKRTAAPRPKVVATYNYRDEFGHVVYRVLRYFPKDFRPQRPTKNGGWQFGLAGVRRLLYGADRLARLKGKVIYLCEGEKDTETAWNIGLEATCCSGGANGWKQEFREFFHDNYVVILPHNDDPGRAFAAQALDDVAGVAAACVILPLPNLEEHGDLADFVAGGGTKADVLRLSQEAFAIAAPRSSNLEADDPPTEDVPLPNGDRIPNDPQSQKQRLHAANGQLPNGAKNGKAPLWLAIREKFASIQPEQLNWLWPNVWLDRAVNLLTGAPGLGKTFVACDLAARVSTGAKWPDDSGIAPIGDVIYMSAEDSYASVLVNRVAAAGGNLDRVHRWKHKEAIKPDGSKDEAELTLEDIDYMAANIEDLPGLKLVIFDPVTSYLGSADANDNAEVRRVLGKLVELAETRGFTVLLITHDKKMNVAAINSPMGSTAFAALPRVVQGLYRDAADSEKKKRVLSPIKNNHGDDRHSRTFTIQSPIGDSRKANVLWCEGLDERSADEVRAENVKLLASFGKDYGEDDTTKKRQTKILERLDLMTTTAGEWVPSRKICDSLGMGGGIFKATIFELVALGILEEEEIDKPLPKGGVQAGGQKAVRRKSFVRTIDAADRPDN